MRYVKRSTGRDGSVRYYFHKAGQPLIRLRAPFPETWAGSAMQAEVAGLLGQLAPDPAPKTLAAALADYELRAADFAGLADSTKALYRVALGEFADQLGDVPIATFKGAYIHKLRDAWATRGHRAANIRLQVLKNVLRPAIIDDTFGGDPFALIPGVRRPRELAEPHPIWPDWVVSAVIARALDEKRHGLARGVALGRFAGPRRGDIVKIALAARKAANGVRRIAFLSGKRRVPVDMREDPRLTRVLDTTPAQQPFTRFQRQRRERAGLVTLPTRRLVYNRESQPYSESGFGQELVKLVQRCFAAGEIDADHYDAHGLRHSFGVELALGGCSDAEGAAMLGQSSPSSFAQYRRQADRIRLADAGSDRLEKFTAKDTNR